MPKQETRFLADESCDFAVIRALRGAGYQVKAIAELCPGASDQKVMQMSVKEGRILLTEDKDFGWMVFAGRRAGASVIFIRFPMQARSLLPEAVVSFVEKAASKLSGSFAVLEPGRMRLISIPKK